MNIATGRLKWNTASQKKVGLVTKPAELTEELQERLELLSKRIYRHLSLSGYARLDYRLSSNGKFYLLEANPNPWLASTAEFFMAARSSGRSYPDMVAAIVDAAVARGK